MSVFRKGPFDRKARDARQDAFQANWRNLTPSRQPLYVGQNKLKAANAEFDRRRRAEAMRRGGGMRINAVLSEDRAQDRNDPQWRLRAAQ